MTHSFDEHPASLDAVLKIGDKEYNVRVIAISTIIEEEIDRSGEYIAWREKTTHRFTCQEKLIDDMDYAGGII